MNRLLDLGLFIFVAIFTYVIFLTQEGVSAYSCVGVVWFLYLMSYVDDAGTS